MEALRELWRYRELFYFLAWRDVRLRYRQTVLGAAWAILQPLLTMVVFTVLFGQVVGIPSNGLPYPVFYLSALLPWTYFANALTQAGNSLVGNSNLITKVYFPRVLLPASSALLGLVDLAMGFLVLLGIMAYYQVGLSWRLIFWPVFLVPLMLLALALGMLFAALHVRYRDVRFITPFLLQLLLFATPIIYPINLVPSFARRLLVLNPLAEIIDGFRAICLPSQPVHWLGIATSCGVITVLLAVATLYFYRTEAYFSDIV